MQKRGQVTIFVITGIVILAAAIILLLVRSTLVKEELETQTTEGVLLSAPVKSYVESCLEKTAEDALVFVGRHGGYYELPEVYDPRFSLPYYFYEDASTYPSQQEVEDHISEYVDRMLFFCTRNFVPFREQGVDVAQGEVRAKTALFDEKARVELAYPLTITRGDASTALSRFSVEIPVRAKIAHKVAGEFMVFQEENPDMICISCLVGLALDNDLRVEMYFVREREIMFTIVDEKIPVKDEPYTYSFLNRYIFAEPETNAVTEP